MTPISRPISELAVVRLEFKVLAALAADIFCSSSMVVNCAVVAMKSSGSLGFSGS